MFLWRNMANYPCYGECYPFLSGALMLSIIPMQPPGACSTKNITENRTQLGHKFGDL